jgi:hypothetical protein
LSLVVVVLAAGAQGEPIVEEEKPLKPPPEGFIVDQTNP